MKTWTLILLLFLTGPTLFAQNLSSTRLSNAAISLTQQKVIYDPQYFVIKYPGGDVPANKGVCTDVVIRAYRLLGIDLQKEVHEDMKSHFSLYPHKWGLAKTDPNIDHRRVPNLMIFFSRHGEIKPISQNPLDYLPGDIVYCMVLPIKWIYGKSDRW